MDLLAQNQTNAPRLYTPGEVVTAQQGFMKGHGTYVEGDDIIASVAGVIEQVNKLVSIKPLKSRYVGEIGDVVVARITEVQQKRWKVDTNSRLDSVLLLSSVNLPGGELRRRVAEDEQAMRKLRTGWNSSQVHEPLRPDEQAAIISVIKRNEELEIAERQRVGRLVERVEKIKSRAVERGPNCCRLCGDTFGILRAQRIICEDCRKSVCPKCSLDISIRYHTTEKTREIWLCRICSETREMWKKTGAWFFKGLPNYEVPSSATSTPTRNTPIVAEANDVLINQRKVQSCQSTPTRNVRVKKLTIRVCDSSSEEELEVIKARGKAEDVVDNACSNMNQVCLKEGDKREAKNGTKTSPTINEGKLQREDSFRMRTFGSIRSFIDGTTGERKLSNAFFFNNRSNSRSEAGSAQPEFDTISTASTVYTTASNTNNRRESSNYCSSHRRSSVSSSWSISDSSSGNSATTASMSAANQANAHCRDPLLGWLEVAITYRENFHTLDATVVRARDLPPMDSLGLTDPYCKLNIITAEGTAKYTRWQKTKCVHKTRNPEFNETLQFVGVEPEELGNALLYVAIFDEDKYGHDFLGAAKIGLSTVHNTNQYRISVPLGPEDQYSNAAEMSQEWPHGKVLVSLCYNTKRRALTVNIKQCVNLIPMDNNGMWHYVVKWRTLNPIYNEEFHFEASPHDLNKQSIIITVWDKDLGKSNDFLGSLIIGFNSKGERLQQWLDCIRLPDHFHEKWHCLAGENPLH
ncbi:Double C2-like domain-containing protein beta [Lucilia cuprina]|nr:Double C2-like domain-containing protein beta [Lucilia cuprina]